MDNSKGVSSSGNSMTQVEYFDNQSKIFHRKTYNIKNNYKQVSCPVVITLGVNL